MIRDGTDSGKMLVRPYYTVVRLPWAWVSGGLLWSQFGLSLAIATGLSFNFSDQGYSTGTQRKSGGACIKDTYVVN